MLSGVSPLPARLLLAYVKLAWISVAFVRYPTFVKSWRRSLGESSRQPPSLMELNVRYQSTGPRKPPYSPLTLHRPNDPPHASSFTPGKSKQRLVRTTRAPPSVFNPKMGLDPGMMSTSARADWGTRSQLIVSPNPSLKRMPSTYIDRPMGLPVKGEARNPR